MRPFRVVALCALALFACEEETAGPTAPVGISVTLDLEADTVGVNGTTQLTATVAGTTNTTVTWRSSAASIATVNETGLVEGVAVGTTTIIAIAEADTTKQDTTEITVTLVAPISITLSPPSATVAVSAALLLTATVDGSVNTAVTYRSSASSVATVDDGGLVRGISPGPVTITAVAVADTTKKATSDITVTAPPVP